jgi:hypothetical protein
LSFGHQALGWHFALAMPIPCLLVKNHFVYRHLTEMIFGQWRVIRPTGIRWAFCFFNDYSMSFSQKPFGLQTFGHNDVRLRQMWLSHLANRH